MAKHTKADLPDLRKMKQTDERIANNPKYSDEARSMARHRADQAQATIAELEAQTD